MFNHRRHTKGFLIGALSGSVLAATTALLLAPKSGSNLRRDIVGKYQSMRKKRWL